MRFLRRKKAAEIVGWPEVCVITDDGSRIYVCQSCGSTRLEHAEMFHFDIGPGKRCSDRC